MAKEFDEIFEEVYQDSSEKLKEIKAKTNKIVMITFAVLLMLNLVVFLYMKNKDKSSIMIFVIISLTILLIVYMLSKNKYDKNYKNIVIRNLITKYNDKLKYDPKKGNLLYEYKQSEFTPSFDEYHSEDSIDGTLRSGAVINSSEVAVYDINTVQKSNGETEKQKVLLFRGYFAHVILKQDSGLVTKIATDNRFKKFSNKRVEVDSSEFEKYFDLLTQDKVRSMELFTSDVLEQLLNMRSLFKDGAIEIKVDGQDLYLRFGCGTMFEVPAFSSGLSKEQFRKYYTSFYYPIEFLETLTANINRLIEIGSLGPM